jgi:membrane protein
MVVTLRSRVDSSVPVRFFRRLGAARPSVLAAAIAYNLFFALVPALASVVVAASVFGSSDEVLAESLATLSRVVPSDTVQFIGRVLEDVALSVNEAKGLAVAGTGIVALWLGSPGIHTIQEVLTRIAELEERRSWIVAKLVSVLLTGGIALPLVVSSLLVVAGATVAERLDSLVGDDWPVELWNRSSVPVAAFCFFLFLAALYRWGSSPEFFSCVARLLAVNDRDRLGLAPLSFLSGSGGRIRCNHPGDIRGGGGRADLALRDCLRHHRVWFDRGRRRAPGCPSRKPEPRGGGPR